jgi:predicted nucleic acid-binding Zn ribbon protein
MIEKKSRVVSYQIDALCEECGVVMRRELGPGNTSMWPGMYVCPECGTQVQSMTDYPHIVFELEGGEDADK